ncbi:MAG: hypothetical protein EWV50_19830 [Microcystis aeruginosa Ma_MB_F_20061100_S20]|uniref:Uncharacterized protein n=1 Tax=Microcystis aeruginosa Ma_MB_F_20061100_S20D TaxID=2486253 RepID=A0A552F1I8_MICAE|nr:MAG: hypothetical protein EWV50_19830 [Microcystis aeruginosa Ma_MB_F_20061100_S20]TRU40556.1 MAG: hypothetical protein EWV78_01035 [Microcystis aeruginosa Ma_MB_F_20061100_S20D]
MSDAPLIKGGLRGYRPPPDQGGIKEIRTTYLAITLTQSSFGIKDILYKGYLNKLTRRRWLW